MPQTEISADPEAAVWLFKNRARRPLDPQSRTKVAQRSFFKAIDASRFCADPESAFTVLNNGLHVVPAQSIFRSVAIEAVKSLIPCAAHSTSVCAHPYGFHSILINHRNRHSGQSLCKTVMDHAAAAEAVKSVVFCSYPQVFSLITQECQDRFLGGHGAGIANKLLMLAEHVKHAFRSD